MNARLTRLAYSLATLAALGRCPRRGHQVALTEPERSPVMKARLTRLAYSLAALAALAAALGAGYKWS
jgi:hypothetical protein